MAPWRRPELTVTQGFMFQSPISFPQHLTVIWQLVGTVKEKNGCELLGLLGEKTHDKISGSHGSTKWFSWLVSFKCDSENKVSGGTAFVILFSVVSGHSATAKDLVKCFGDGPEEPLPVEPSRNPCIRDVVSDPSSLDEARPHSGFQLGPRSCPQSGGWRG